MINVEIPKEIEREMEKKGGFESIISLISDEDIRRLERLTKTLADEKRLKILYALHRQRMCVCMLAELTKCSYSQCSYHIAKLRELNLVQPKNIGNYLIYSLTPYGRKIVRYFEKLKEVMK